MHVFGSKITLDLPELMLCLCYLLRLRVKHVGIHGIEYRPECVLRLHGMDDLENVYPVYDKWMRLLFGKTRNLSELNWIEFIWTEFIWILTELETLCFHNHFMVCEVERSDKKAVVFHHDLPWHGVLHVVKKKWQQIYCWERHILYWRHNLKRLITYTKLYCKIKRTLWWR